MTPLIFIPARLESVRLPRKPLLLIGNKPLIQWSWESAIAANITDQVYVLTDSSEIEQTVLDFGGKCILTPPCASGTDRCGWAATNYDWPNDSYVINLQGDRPFTPPDIFHSVQEVFEQEELPASIVTLVTILPWNDVRVTIPETIKVVLDNKSCALYFSRAVIPYYWSVAWNSPVSCHIGIYAYPLSVLKELCALEVSSLEKAEELEQLRFLQNNYSIYCIRRPFFHDTDVNSKEDLEKAKEYARIHKLL